MNDVPQQEPARGLSDNPTDPDPFFQNNELPREGPVVSGDSNARAPWRERIRPRNYHELTQGRITAAALVLVGLALVGGVIIGLVHPDGLANYGKAVVEPTIGLLLLIIGYYFGRSSSRNV